MNAERNRGRETGEGGGAFEGEGPEFEPCQDRIEEKQTEARSN